MPDDANTALRDKVFEALDLAFYKGGCKHLLIKTAQDIAEDLHGLPSDFKDYDVADLVSHCAAWLGEEASCR